MGARGLGKVAPWPSVGCVLVKEGRVIARGTTCRQSHRHAEVVALDRAGDAARGATAYVTLEPCSHHGSTPPCADALVRAGVARVVVAVGDPNPQVNGQGLDRLRAAGVAVTTGVLEAEARQAHAGFFKVMQDGRPFVTLKLAASLDGRIATATGESKWITGPAARRLVHLERARHDGVLVGSGTVRADDPDLRHRDLGIGTQPVRIVLSRRLDIPLNSKLAASAGEAPLWLVHGADVAPEIANAWAGLGARLIPARPGRGRQLDMTGALEALAEAGLTRIYCEGGGAVAVSLMAAGLVDELHLFNAGKALGAEGQPMVGALGLDCLAEAPQFQLLEQRKVGVDLLSIWRPTRSDVSV